jgi:hypothetical protein
MSTQPPSSPRLFAVALAAGLALALGLASVTPLAADELPAPGPQIEVAPVGDSPLLCPVQDPQAAFFPTRETWLWVEQEDEPSGALGAALFTPGAAAPSRLEEVGPAQPGLWSDQNGEHAYAAWPGGRHGWFVAELAADGPDVVSNLASWAFNPEGRDVVAVDLAVTPSGHVLLVWTEAPRGASTDATVHAVLLDPDLAEVTPRVLVGEIPGGSLTSSQPAVVNTSEDPTAEAAGFVAAWHQGAGAATARIVARGLRAFPSSDTPEPFALEAGELFVVSQDESGFGFGRPVTPPELASTPGGGFVAGWGNLFETDPPFPALYLRRYAGPGRPLGDQQRLEPDGLRPRLERPGLAVDETGRIAFTFASAERDFSGFPSDFFFPVYGQLLDAQGEPLCEVFRVSDLDALANDRVHVRPRPFFDRDGDLLVLWSDFPVTQPPQPGICPGGRRVLGRRFEIACVDDQLCLLDQRFEATVTWIDPFNGGSGVGRARQLTTDTGAFWFFDDANLELMVKVIDGRSVNGHYWVFFGSLTNVGFELTVRDRLLDRSVTYVNEPFTFASRGDTTAFPANPAP